MFFIKNFVYLKIFFYLCKNNNKNIKIMKKEITDEELLRDGYKTLYLCSTPSVDYDELINNCRKYIDYECFVHFTEKPLTNKECEERGWRKDINYMDYTISLEMFNAIIENKILTHKLEPTKAEAFRNSMQFGCGPRIICEPINYQERLIVEYLDLSNKIMKLNNFIDSDKYNELTEENQELLLKQKIVMIEYLDILTLRININLDIKTQDLITNFNKN